MGDKIKVGDRVRTCRGELGHIKEIDGFGFYGVRLLTPNNEPSALTTWTDEVELIGDNVVPMPMSNEWWNEARAFCEAIENALLEE